MSIKDVDKKLDKLWKRVYDGDLKVEEPKKRGGILFEIQQIREYMDQGGV